MVESSQSARFMKILTSSSSSAALPRCFSQSCRGLLPATQGGGFCLNYSFSRNTFNPLWHLFFFSSWRIFSAAVALLLLPKDNMSGTEGDEPLPPYEDIDRSNAASHAADAVAANASQNEYYHDQKSAISTTQQVSAGSDNYRASRM